MSATTLVFGAGWLGEQWAERDPAALLLETDVADAALVARELDLHRPARVVNAAGRTGRPNVDSLESDPGGTYRSNVIGPIVLAAACRARGVHLTHLSSGCLYTGDNGGGGWAETDPPNFRGSLYARTKGLAEAALADFGALQLRLRLPISGAPHPRNLLTKLLRYDRVVRVANSVTVLEDFWPAALALVERGATGVWNLVNPGAEHHDDLLRLYAERTGRTHLFQVVAEADIGLDARRSNCLLSTAKLEAAGLGLPPLDVSLPRLIDAYAAATAGAGADR